jgi:hypothetical protein
MKHLRTVWRFGFAFMTLGLITWMAGLPSAKASVDLIYFRAIGGQQVITLEWATATEIDFLGFLIYRGLSSDLAQAQTIGSLIPAQGLPPAGGAEYAYVDTSVVDGVLYYYWLASVDQGDNGPGNYDYEGPRTVSTAGGTTINTPVPTVPGAATSTPTATLTPASTGTTTTNEPEATSTSGSSSATATVAPTTDPEPTVEPTPSRIPAGTFPQPPTPTRFAFSPTTAAASTPATSPGTAGSESNAGSTDNGNETENPPPVANGGFDESAIPSDTTPFGEQPSIADSPTGSADSSNGAQVLGEEIASQNQSTDALPPPAQPQTPLIYWYVPCFSAGYHGFFDRRYLYFGWRYHHNCVAHEKRVMGQFAPLS